MNCRLQNPQLAEKIAAKLNERIGFNSEEGLKFVGEEIHTDEEGCFFYIPRDCLKWNHPLIMAHYRGYLFVVLPDHDSVELMMGSISVDDYIDSAVWSYGFLWGGGKMLGGVHWQPLDADNPGIRYPEMIRRYLTILMCRTYMRSCGYDVVAEKCAKCYLESCPLSIYEKNIGASWNNEVREIYDVNKLVELIEVRIEKEYGLKIEDCYCQYIHPKHIVLKKGRKEGTAIVYIPTVLTADLRYHPGTYDLKAISEEFIVDVDEQSFERVKIVAKVSFLDKIKRALKKISGK